MSRKKRLYIGLTATFVVLLVVAAVFFLRDSSRRGSGSYLDRARESYAAGDYENALSFLRRASESGQDQETAMLMADCYEAMANYAKAIETLRALNPNDPAIARRIQSIEEKRALQSRSETISVAGVEFDRNTKEAKLNGRQLTGEQMRELTALYALDSLSLREDGITDISLLSSFGGLDRLDLAGNSITDISALAGLRELRYLDLEGNPVADFSPLYGLSGLTTLRIVQTGASEEQLNQLAEALPFCTIRCEVEDEEEVLLGSMHFRTDVEVLNLDGKGIRDVSAIGECTRLISLSIRDNSVTDLLPLMNLPQLRVLDLAGNEVSDLRPLIGLPMLEELDVSDNLVTDSSPFAVMKALKQLNLSGNQLTDYVGLGKMEKVEILMLQNTGAEDTDLAELEALTGLRTLDLRENHGLSDRAVSKLNLVLNRCNIICSDLIYEVDFSGHMVRSDERSLAFPASGIEIITGLENMTALEELDLSGNAIQSLSSFEISPARDTLKKLNLANNRIEVLDAIRGYSLLEELNLSGNGVVQVDVLKQLTALKNLDLRGNPLLQEQIADLQSALPQCRILF